MRDSSSESSESSDSSDSSVETSSTESDDSSDEEERMDIDMEECRNEFLNSINLEVLER